MAGKVLWVSTGLTTRGGVASYMRTMLDTPLAAEWSIRHVATHRDGPVGAKVAAFVRGAGTFVAELGRRPRLVHLHMASRGSFARKATLAWLATLARVPVVVHVHGGGFAAFHDRSPRPVRWAIRRTLERATAVIALGPGWAARLVAIAPTAQVAIVPNAVRVHAAVAQPGPGEPVHVVFLGDVRAGKGVFTLLESWAKAAAGHPARLTIAGGGELDKARALAADLGIADSVDIAGWVDPADVPALMRSAQVLALPSLAEGQPIVVLDAMANGMCVVASSVGGIPDLVDPTCGVLVPPGDTEALTAALTRVLADGAGRAAIGAAALARARRDFDVEVTWRRLDRIYRELCS